MNNKEIPENEVSVKINIDIAKENGIFDDDNDYVLYILVNDDLKMDLNKLIKFCCNSICEVVKVNENLKCKSENYINWSKTGEKIIIFKAKEEDLLYCVNQYSDPNKEIWCQNILGLGNPEKSPFSMTTVAFTPILRKNTPEFISKLKELKNLL